MCASARVQTALRDCGVGELTVVSRRGDENYVNLYERHADAQLLVNATPAGMYPHTGESPVELEKLPALETIVLPQQALLDAGSLPDGDYTVELTGGGA